MSKEEMQELETGDIVRHKNDTKSFVVMQNYKNRVTLVQTAELSNPHEWDLIFKARHERVDDLDKKFDYSID